MLVFQVVHFQDVLQFCCRCVQVQWRAMFTVPLGANKEAGCWSAPGSMTKCKKQNRWWQHFLLNGLTGKVRASNHFWWRYRPRLPHPRPYLSRLESGWEEAPCPLLLPPPLVPENPLPVPVDWRFPDRSFSTAARFPVRAASRSSCSFPITDPKDFGEDAGKTRKQGRLAVWVNSSRIPLFIPSTASYFSVFLLVWRRNKSSLRRWIRLSRSTVPLEEKFRRRHGTSIEQTSSDQSPELRPSLPWNYPFLLYLQVWNPPRNLGTPTQPTL